ncbi:MAG TPA: methyl-accepting chemotaxis protein, partial [Kofleriaceae bacterium]|nr:methyl-accepting chemotaxis protein [Kofleriaceae bacterium]
ATEMLTGEGRKQSRELSAVLRDIEKEVAKRMFTPAATELRVQTWVMTYAVEALANAEKLLIIADTEEARAALNKELEGHDAQFDKVLARIASLAETPEEKRLVGELRRRVTSYHEVHRKGRELANADTGTKAIEVMRTKGLPALLAAGAIAERTAVAANKELAREQHESHTQFVSTRSLLMMILGGSLLFGVILSIWTVRYISRSLRDAGELAHAVANGDLTRTIAVKNTDEIGTMIATLNQMVENVRRVARNVTAASTNVASGSEELAATSHQVAQGAAEQSAAVEQSTAAMEEMAASVQQNADNASQTDKLASKSAVDAQQSGQAVSETVTAMKNIAEKISIIEEIARKTDLLALNAAVEAARAGDHGKGFAVVASEVRKLAERSALAAAEISQLSKSGVVLAEGAGAMLLRLVPDIRKTAELVQEVSSASREQNTGVDQTNRALQDLDKVTQQNAAAAEQMAATANELSSQAQQLQTAVAFFKIGNGEQTIRPTTSTKAPQMPRAISVKIPRIKLADKPAKPAKGIKLDLGASDDDHLFERHAGHGDA